MTARDYFNAAVLIVMWAITLANLSLPTPDLVIVLLGIAVTTVSGYLSGRIHEMQDNIEVMRRARMLSETARQILEAHGKEAQDA